MNAPDAARERVVLGRVTGVFGIKGWVKIESYTDPVESILSFRDWLLEQRTARRAVAVREGRRHGRQVVAHIESFDDRDRAAELVGAEISVPRSSLPKLGAREFYRADLIGLTVRGGGGTVLGKVDHFIDAPAGPVMVVRGEQDLWLPARAPQLRRVDLTKGEVHVEWQAGDESGGQPAEAPRDEAGVEPGGEG